MCHTAGPRVSNVGLRDRSSAQTPQRLPAFSPRPKLMSCNLDLETCLDHSFLLCSSAIPHCLTLLPFHPQIVTMVSSLSTSYKCNFLTVLFQSPQIVTSIISNNDQKVHYAYWPLEGTISSFGKYLYIFVKHHYFCK